MVRRTLAQTIIGAFASASLGACGGPQPAADAGGDAGCRFCQPEDAAWPDVPAGRCTAVAPSPEALLPAGPASDGLTAILPGGRRVTPAGRTVPVSGFPMAGRLFAGGTRLVVTDGTDGDEYLRLFDASSGAELSAIGPLREPEGLFYGLAVTADGRRIYASGGPSDVVHVIDRDPSTDALAVAGGIAVPNYVAGLALSPDETTLFALRQVSGYVAVIDTATQSVAGTVSAPGGGEPYDVVVSPDGAFAYLTQWAARGVVQIALASRTVQAVAAVGKNPEGLVLSPDGARLYVACSDADTIAVIETASMTVVANWSSRSDASLPSGSCPSAVALHPDGSRLYVTNACENALDVFDTATGTRVGRLPTAWWPTDVEVGPDGTLFVLTGKGVGSGPNPLGVQPRNTMGGSLSIITPPADADLVAGAAQVDANNRRPLTFAGIDCPAGAPYDFPVPAPGGPVGPTGPIRHVILIVRENKTYDVELGDLPGANGDPSLTLFGETVTPNTHALAEQFANLDNFYVDSEASIQGHVWTTTGRTSDYVERTWFTIAAPGGAAGRPFDGAGANEASQPEIGQFFDVLDAAGIDFTIFGEPTTLLRGAGMRHMDRRFPATNRVGAYDLDTLDVVKADYLAGLVLNEGLPAFWYVSLPNDHTYGTRAGRPTPESMVADNDAATGIIVDAISRSVFWPGTVIFITEDDPQDGGDHVDAHRSICVVVSPWVKRAWVSSVHYDFASLYRTIELLLGVPPMSQFDALATPMTDVFTGTPDFTDYVARPRLIPEAYNTFFSPGALESDAMRFDVPDQAKGLARVLWRAMRGTEPPWQPGDDD